MKKQTTKDDAYFLVLQTSPILPTTSSDSAYADLNPRSRHTWFCPLACQQNGLFTHTGQCSAVLTTSDSGDAGRGQRGDVGLDPRIRGDRPGAVHAVQPNIDGDPIAGVLGRRRRRWRRQRGTRPVGQHDAADRDGAPRRDGGAADRQHRPPRRGHGAQDAQPPPGGLLRQGQGRRRRPPLPRQSQRGRPRQGCPARDHRQYEEVIDQLQGLVPCRVMSCVCVCVCGGVMWLV